MMDRSEINEIILESDAFIRSFGYQMPPFAYWTPAMLQERVQTDSAMIRNHALGWDITDLPDYPAISQSFSNATAMSQVIECTVTMGDTSGC